MTMFHPALCLSAAYPCIHENKLEGGCITHATLLARFFLRTFFFIGAIPSSLGNCVKLARLLLDSNKLGGGCITRSTELPRFFQRAFF